MMRRLFVAARGLLADQPERLPAELSNATEKLAERGAGEAFVQTLLDMMPHLGSARELREAGALVYASRR